MQKFKREIFLEQLEQNISFFYELIEMALEQFDMRMAALQKAVEANRADHIRLEAHAIKGIALQLGDHQLAQAAYSVEQAAKEKTLEKIGALMAALKQEYQRLMPVLTAELRKATLEQKADFQHNPISVNQ